MFSPAMVFFSLLPTGFEPPSPPTSPPPPSPVALDPSLQPHAAVSLNRAAVFNASCDCVDLRSARSADGPGGGYALLATPPLSGLNASFDLSFEVFFQNPGLSTGIGLLLFDANDHDKDPDNSYGDGLGSYTYYWRAGGTRHWGSIPGQGCQDIVPEAEYAAWGFLPAENNPSRMGSTIGCTSVSPYRGPTLQNEMGEKEEWANNSAECNEMWNGRWLLMRAFLEPTETAGRYTFGMEIDGRVSNKIRTIDLSVSSSWRVAIGSAEFKKWQGSQQKVLVRNLTLARVSLHRGAAFNASCDCVDLRGNWAGYVGGYMLLVPPLAGFDVTFEVFFKDPTANTGIGLLFFDAFNHEVLDLEAYQHVWEGGGSCHLGGITGGGCKRSIGSEYAAWGVVAAHYAGIDRVMKGCDEAITYRNSEATDTGTDGTDEGLFSWAPGSADECTAKWSNRWVRVRAILAPGGAEGEYTFGVETDGGHMHTCTISHLFPTHSWRLGVGSSETATLAKVLVRGVTMAEYTPDPPSAPPSPPSPPPSPPPPSSPPSAPPPSPQPSPPPPSPPPSPPPPSPPPPSPYPPPPSPSPPPPSPSPPPSPTPPSLCQDLITTKVPIHTTFFGDGA